MKKIITLLSGVFVIAFSFQACKNQVEGNGKLATKEFAVKDFNGVLNDLSADVNITVQEGAAYSCKITGDENILPLLKVEVAKEELIITTNGTASYNTKNNITATITMPSIQSMKLLGSGEMKLEGEAISKDMTFGLMGSGTMEANNATFDQLTANLSGSGDIKFNNCVSLHARYGIKGSGNINAYGNSCERAEVNLTGSGAVETTVADSLDISLTGSGDVHYKGTAKVTKKVTGSGEVVEED
jgi:Putative auto-transporter adhesin, head GIN domain